MGLEDREALEVILGALRGPGADVIVAHFYTCWFAIDPTVRDRAELERLRLPVMAEIPKQK